MTTLDACQPAELDPVLIDGEAPAETTTTSVSPATCAGSVTLRLVVGAPVEVVGVPRTYG